MKWLFSFDGILWRNLTPPALTHRLVSCREMELIERTTMTVTTCGPIAERIVIGRRSAISAPRYGRRCRTRGRTTGFGSRSQQVQTLYVCATRW